MDYNRYWPNTDTIWMEIVIDHSNQQGELRAVQLVIIHESLSLVLCTDCWVVLKGLTVDLGRWEFEEWMIKNKPLYASGYLVLLEFLLSPIKWV